MNIVELAKLRKLFGGSGGSGGGVEVLTGEVTWNTVPITLVEFTVEHGLGRIPKMFVLVPDFETVAERTIGVHLVSTQEYGMLARYNGSALKIYNNLDNCKIVTTLVGRNPIVFVDENKLVLRTFLDSMFTVAAGDTYRWFIVG